MSWTAERPASGIVVHQPTRGFRYAVDAFWLAGFALEPGVPARALDLGTGSGIVAFLLAARGIDVTGLDVRPEWEEGWRRSLTDSDVHPVFWRMDARDLDPGPEARVELVTCNPPYQIAGTGPTAPDPWKAAARTESTSTLADFVHAAIRALTPDGRAVFVLPDARADEAVGYAAAQGFNPVRRLRIGPRVLLDLRRDGAWLEDLTLDRTDPRVCGFFPERAR